MPLLEHLREQAARARQPLQVQFEVTHRCNQACRHCYLRGSRAEDELALAEIEDVLDQLAALQTLFLSFTGGEFFAREDAGAILEAARARHFVFVVLTNGTLLADAHIACLRRCQPLEVHTSLLGLERTHDELAGYPGAFARTVAAMDALRAAGVRVRVKLILTQRSLPERDALEALAAAHADAWVRSVDLIPALTGEAPPADLVPTAADLRRLCQAADADVLCRPGPGAETPVCSAARNLMAIGPTGEVYPCLTFRLAAGNVRQTPLARIWNAPVLREIASLRRRDLLECAACETRGLCTFCPGRAWQATGDWRRRAEPLCAQARRRREALG